MLSTIVRPRQTISKGIIYLLNKRGGKDRVGGGGGGGGGGRGGGEGSLKGDRADRPYPTIKKHRNL